MGGKDLTNLEKDSKTKTLLANEKDLWADVWEVGELDDVDI